MRQFSMGSGLTLGILASVFGLSLMLMAETLTPAQEKALAGAIEELTHPAKRAEALKKSPKAAESDKFVKEVGGEYSEDLYQLAGKLMENLTREGHGDPDQMDQILEKARKDPEGFAKTFTPEQKRLLKELGQKIEKNKKPSLP